MAPAVHTVEIARPPEDVFPYLADGEKMQRWIGGLVEFTPLDAGEPRAGSRSRQRVKQEGFTVTVESEIVELEPNERLTARIHASALATTIAYRLEPRDGGTRLTATVESEPRGFGGRLLGGLVASQAERKLVADLGRLKTLLESS